MLPAVLVPVLIHLLSRRRYRRVPWAAMEFLLRAQSASRRRVRWQSAILLALRVAVVFLLVVNFARPGLIGAAGLAGGHGSGDVFVLIDDSASMACGRGGRPAIERARGVTEGLAGRTLERGGRLTVYAAGGREPVLASSAGRTTAGEAARRLAAVGPTGGPFDLQERLGRLGSDAAETSVGEPSFVVVTDMRASDWGAAEPGQEARAALAALGAHGPVRIVDVGDLPFRNGAVVAADHPGRFLYAGEPATFRVVVANGGEERLAAGLLEVRLDGRPMPSLEHPEVPPRVSREVPAQVLVPRAGSHALQFSLAAGDDFGPDDTFVCAFEAHDSVPVLIVEGHSGAGSYLAAALRAEASGPGIQPEVIDALREPAGDLGGYAAVLLVEVPRPPTWLDRLAAYVEQGGRLALFAGPATDAQAWNEASSWAGLAPARLLETVRPPDGPVHIAAGSYEDPMLAPFAGWEAVFGAARFSAYRRLEPAGEAAVLLRFSDEVLSPALVVVRRGSGCAALFASSAGSEWNDWPYSQVGRVSYLALMSWFVEQGILASAARNLELGDRLSHPGGQAGRHDAEMVLVQAVRDADPQSLSARLSAGVSGSLLSEPLRRQGVWRLRTTGPSRSPEDVLIAVNVPAHERRLGRVAEGFRFGRDAGRHISLVRDGAAPGGGAAMGAGAELWPMVAWVLLALLVVESAAACAFGNPAGGFVPG
jgi:hypothetical protein